MIAGDPDVGAIERNEVRFLHNVVVGHDVGSHVELVDQTVGDVRDPDVSTIESHANRVRISTWQSDRPVE